MTQQFPPLEQETRSHIPTDCCAYHINRASQTLRAWACLENGPIRPIRINGRLAWPVAEIRNLLEGGAK
ncbi:diguanylate cyclase [Novimethylophilus kurashikiensis]|uniref:Diguanylate cyclase n=1 Tax=Novimethylophilus kurashikiensis TaxID=1825523 RepID=A0A2R5FC16_9PROT|nr:diguanylate cyclase [Novimethylophilus kurashikiensis]